MAAEIPTAHVGGFDTVALTRAALADQMVKDCLETRRCPDRPPKLVFSSNGQGIALAGREPKFAAAMGAADLIHADGMPVVLASKLTRCPLPERIATTDFFHDAARAAVTTGLRFYFLGSTDSQNRAAAEAAMGQYTGLEIVGRHHGYFDESDDERVCQEIVEARPDVLWVALGKPRQEYWSLKNRDRLRGVGWIKTCGGLYSFLAGDSPRAPQWMRSLSLEWAYRAIKEPRRLGIRYLTTNPYAGYRLLTRTKRSP